MADQVMNVAKGRFVEFFNRVDTNDPTNSVIVIVLLEASSEADATLIDYDTLGALLGGSNTEAAFTNYARIVLDQDDIATISPDDTNDRFDLDIADQTFSSAGNGTNNTLDKLLVCFDGDSTGGADTAIIPISHHDFAATTDGTDLVAQIATAGLLRAA
jgi:hypothetical protein